jgi:hypothetical protein
MCCPTAIRRRKPEANGFDRSFSATRPQCRLGLALHCLLDTREAGLGIGTYAAIGQLNEALSLQIRYYRRRKGADSVNRLPRSPAGHRCLACCGRFIDR